MRKLIGSLFAVGALAAAACGNQKPTFVPVSPTPIAIESPKPVATPLVSTPITMQIPTSAPTVTPLPPTPTKISPTASPTFTHEIRLGPFADELYKLLSIYPFNKDITLFYYNFRKAYSEESFRETLLEDLGHVSEDPYPWELQFARFLVRNADKLDHIISFSGDKIESLYPTITVNRFERESIRKILRDAGFNQGRRYGTETWSVDPDEELIFVDKYLMISDEDNGEINQILIDNILNRKMAPTPYREILSDVDENLIRLVIKPFGQLLYFVQMESKVGNQLLIEDVFVFENNEQKEAWLKQKSTYLENDFSKLYTVKGSYVQINKSLVLSNEEWLFYSKNELVGESGRELRKFRFLQPLYFE